MTAQVDVVVYAAALINNGNMDIDITSTFNLN